MRSSDRTINDGRCARFKTIGNERETNNQVTDNSEDERRSSLPIQEDSEPSNEQENVSYARFPICRGKSELKIEFSVVPEIIFVSVEKTVTISDFSGRLEQKTRSKTIRNE